MQHAITYNIPSTLHQRGSKQTIKGLNKQNLADWIAWINSKNGTYKVK